MAKRRLNKQQQFRIKKVQEERAARAARKEKKVQEQADAGELGPEQEGLVIAHYGQQLDVEALEGDQEGDVVRCFVRAKAHTRKGSRLRPVRTLAPELGPDN